ncbi:DUF5667 domain-containing protein [Streptomyces sp. NPDC054933]
MIGQATAHRRANAFAQALESADTREATPERAAHAADRHADPHQGRLLAMADALADVPRPELDPEVKMVQRAQLIAAMEAALADGSLDTSSRVPEQRATGGPVDLRRLRPRSRWSRRLAAGGLTVGVAAGAFSGIAAASTDALPGDTLYGLKRGMEDLRLGMTGDDAARGKVLLDMASTRMQEARRLLERGRSGPLDAESVREVGNALAGMHNEASQGHDLLSGAYQRDGSLAPIEALNAFSQAHRTTWSQLRGKLPPQLHQVGTQVSSVFDAIDQEVAPLQHLLPPAPGGSGARDRHTGKPAGGAHHDSIRQESTPSSGSVPQGDDGVGRGNTTPSAPESPGQGLLGGTGLLNPPSAGGGQPSPTGGGSAVDKPQPDTSTPPLLPGLPGLPGLGLNGGDTSR